MVQQEYLDRAKSVLSETFRANDSDGSMTAASAAYLLKRTIGSFEDVGFFKFKELLQALQAEGFLQTGANSKQAFSFVLKVPTQAKSTQLHQVQRRLRADIWYAFVKEVPPGKRFFNSKTGLVKTHCESVSGAEWIEIVPIDPANEKQLAIDFLEQHQIPTTEAQNSLNDPKWYIAFSDFLTHHSAQIANAWKRERSKSVVEIVEAWRQEHGLDEALVYEQMPMRVLYDSPRKHLDNHVGNGRDPLRNALLNAIAKMSVDELLEIRVPASYLVTELRPDLLK